MRIRLSRRVCFWNMGNTWNENSVAELQNYCESILNVFDRSDLPTFQFAFEVGFDDCLDIDCSEQELNSKLNQAFRDWQVQRRLSSQTNSSQKFLGWNLSARLCNISAFPLRIRHRALLASCERLGTTKDTAPAFPQERRWKF